MSTQRPFWAHLSFFCIANLICKPKENLIGSESRPSYCSGLRASVGTYSVPDPIQLHSKPWQHGTSSDLSSKVKAHCAAASISHYCGTEQMQNLDWNKCFQRVSDAGLHFRLCSPPLVGMYLCSLPCDHPGRLGRRVHQHSLPRPGAPRWSGWGPVSISNRTNSAFVSTTDLDLIGFIYARTERAKTPGWSRRLRERRRAQKSASHRRETRSAIIIIIHLKEK